MFSSIYVTQPSILASVNLPQQRPRRVSEPTAPHGNQIEGEARVRYRHTRSFPAKIRQRRVIAPADNRQDFSEIDPGRYTVLKHSRQPDILRHIPDEMLGTADEDVPMSGNEAECDIAAMHTPDMATPTRASSTTGSTTGNRSMRITLTQLFKPLVTDGNKAGIDALIRDRARRLSELEIDPGELLRRLRNANYIDDITGRFFGAFSSLGFIGGGQAWSGLSHAIGTCVSATTLPFMPGAVVGIVDRLASSVLTATHVHYYTKVCPDHLEPVMRDCLELHRRGLGAEAQHQAGALAATYTLRNVARIVAAPIAAHYGCAALADSAIENLGGMPAGALSEYLRNDSDRADMLMHPGYLLGRTDWIEQLETLEQDVWSSERLNDLQYRTGSKFLEIPTLLANAFKDLLTLDSLAEISILSVGLAVNEWVKTAIVDALKPHSEEASEFLKTATSVNYLIVLYVTVVTCLTLVSRPTETLNILRRRSGDAKPAADIPQSSPGRVLRRRATPQTQERF